MLRFEIRVRDVEAITGAVAERAEVEHVRGAETFAEIRDETDTLRQCVRDAEVTREPVVATRVAANPLLAGRRVRLVLQRRPASTSSRSLADQSSATNTPACTIVEPSGNRGARALVAPV